MGKILVPLDGSEVSEGGLPHALVLARATGDGIVLLRAVDPGYVPDQRPAGMMVVGDDFMGLNWADLMDSAGEYLNGLADILRGAGRKVSVAVNAGDPAAAIVDAVSADSEIRVIAMSTHARTGVDRVLLGSVAEEVLRAATVPLLMVQPKPEQDGAKPSPQPYRTILAPV